MTALFDGFGLKALFSAAALILTFAAFVPYYRGIQRDEIRPHVFTWFIWAAGTVTVFAAQVSDGAGVGAWPIGVSGLLTGGVAVFAWMRAGDTSIVRMDWVFLILAASALPLWFFTSTALSAVIILTILDLLGFGPSVRKAYQVPREESATFYIIGAIRNGFVLLALENVSWTTALFPAVVGIACVCFVALIFARRQMVAK